MDGQRSDAFDPEYPSTDPREGAALRDRSLSEGPHRVDTDMQVGETARSTDKVSATVTSIRARPDGSRPAMTREEALASGPGRVAAGSRVSSGDIVNLLRQYRVAEVASRRATRGATSMGETDLLALRLLLDAEAEGRSFTPGGIATALGISTASTTALIDRLSSASLVERRPHETDRRSTVLVPTVGEDDALRETIERGRASIARLVDDIPPHEREVVARFLTNLIGALRDTP
jgi:DNA-binding MarR family transcriptional regulator